MIRQLGVFLDLCFQVSAEASPLQQSHHQGPSSCPHTALGRGPFTRHQINTYGVTVRSFGFYEHWSPVQIPGDFLSPFTSWFGTTNSLVFNLSVKFVSSIVREVFLLRVGSCQGQSIPIQRCGYILQCQVPGYLLNISW